MGWFGNTPIFWKHPYTSHLPKRNSTMEVPHLSKHIGTTCDLQDWFFSNRTSLVGGWITHLKHMRTSNWIISPGRGEQITRFETTTTTLLKYTSPAPRNCSRWTGKNTTKKNNTVFLFTWNGKKHTHTHPKKRQSCGLFFACSICFFLFTIYLCSGFLEGVYHILKTTSFSESPNTGTAVPRLLLEKILAAKGFIRKNTPAVFVETPSVYLDLWLILVIGGGYKSLYVYIWVRVARSWPPPPPLKSGTSVLPIGRDN